MSVDLPKEFLQRPIAHRALHDVTDGRPENSRAAVRAAVSGGYAIELDVQMSADGRAMTFHDYDLDRLTVDKGPLSQRTSAELGKIALKGGDEGVPTLGEVLEIVSGRVPLLVEIKDQDGALGTNVGPLEEAVAKDLHGYDGPAAVMSFNPHSVAAMRSLSPELARGLVTEAFPVGEWAVPEERLAELRMIPDFERVGASFISHDHKDLSSPHVARLKAQGVPILCWTIRSAEAEMEARKIADNVTFERYLPG